MAKNPMFGTKMYANGSTAPSNALNDENKRYFRGRNYFNYSRKVYNTLRYADLTPIEAVHGVEGDILKFASRHKIRSYTLKSPLQSDIFLKKVYTQVDMKCILPNNWDIIYQHPLIGDDVPSDAYTSSSNFFPLIYEICHQLSTHKDTILANANIYSFTFLIKFILFLESIFSNGSLLSSLGYHASPMIVWQSNKDFDDAFNSLISEVNASYSPGYCLDTDKTFSTFNEYLDYIRLNPDCLVRLEDDSETSAVVEKFLNFISYIQWVGASNDEIKTPINIDVLAAYQISCVNFFSRDEIDNIFSAEKYMNLLGRYITDFNSASISKISTLTFEYNGTTRYYDYLSSHFIDGLLTSIFEFVKNVPEQLAADGDKDNFDSFFAYFAAIFNYQSNLRYGDYFTGSKKNPLAVGDITTSVDNNSVNAIDSTISLLRARFYNAINRVGRTFSSYLKLMDGDEAPRDTEPRWLATITSRVTGFEVENTSENQGNIVTILKSSDDKYVYEIEVGSPCIIIGIACFDIQRVYSHSIDRFFFHRNRYDMFNKFMQNVGDQPIYQQELESSRSGFDLDDSLPFGWTPRHMEYKQRFPIASGAYVSDGTLSSYLFITDNNIPSMGLYYDHDQDHIDSKYIRSSNVEFDRFYSSLTGFGLCYYFHFLIEFDNQCHAYRKMLKNPTIL